MVSPIEYIHIFMYILKGNVDLIIVFYLLFNICTCIQYHYKYMQYYRASLYSIVSPHSVHV